MHQAAQLFRDLISDVCSGLRVGVVLIALHILGDSLAKVARLQNRFAIGHTLQGCVSLSHESWPHLDRILACNEIQDFLGGISIAAEIAEIVEMAF